jgi:hypothetical protein
MAFSPFLDFLYLMLLPLSIYKSVIIVANVVHWSFHNPSRSSVPSITLFAVLQCVRKVAVYLHRCWKWCTRAAIQAWTRLILFANTFCRSPCEMFSYLRSYCSFYPMKHIPPATSILTTKSTYRSPSAQRLSERTVENVARRFFRQ